MEVDQQEVVDAPVADVVDDEDGDIASLLDSIMDDESGDGQPDPEATEEEVQPEGEGGDTPDPEAGETEDAPTGGENPELERIRLENQQHREFQRQLQASFLQKQTEQQRQAEEKKLADRFDHLDDIDDPEVRARERGAILADVRTQERNVFLPRINNLEQEKETAAQGLVALHYALESTIADLYAGEIDITKVKPEDFIKTVQNAAMAYMDFESPTDMQREIAARNELKAKASARVRELSAENTKLKTALAAYKHAGRQPAAGGTGRGNAALPVKGSQSKDDGSIHWLVDSLDTPMDDEATGTDY